MYRSGCRGESREKHHLDFQEEMRDTDQFGFPMSSALALTQRGGQNTGWGGQQGGQETGVRWIPATGEFLPVEKSFS